MGRKRKRKKRKKKKIRRTVTFDIPSSQPSKPKEDVIITDEDSKILSDKHTEEEKEEIQRIFEIFLDREVDEENENEKKEEKGDSDDSGDESDSDDEDRKDIVAPPSKKNLKHKGRIGITHLKRIVEFPEVVEPHDSNSHEPLLLVDLKSYPKYVSVPKHWRKPKRYLQSKRGIEKPPFDLPEFIQKTGIEEIRNNIISKQKTQSARQRMRARMNPKMHKGDLDYQVLHDAFFKYQQRPPMTIIGDIFEEGKETNAQVKDLRPGKLSKKLRNSLGMPDGAPPPWLFNMQRYGPPPSYPWLKVPGVNGPIPHGAVWGYFPGGWGQAPRDENGKLLFTSVFLEEEDSGDSKLQQEECWGEVEEEEEDEDEDEDDDDEDSGSDEEEEEEEEDEVDEEKRKRDRADLLNKSEELIEKNIQREKEEISRLEPLKLRKIDPSGKMVPPPPPPVTSQQNEKKELYRVVEMQNREIEQKELVGSTFQYNLGNQKEKEGGGGDKEEGEEEGKKKEGEDDGDLSTATTGRKRKRGWDIPPDQKRKKKKFKF